MTLKGKGRYIIVLLIGLQLFTGCSLVRYVPEDEYLLNKVKIKSDIEGVEHDELSVYLHQKPNNAVLGFWRLKLKLYNSSSEDTTKWRNRWLRRIGEPPVIYDSLQAEYSREQIEKVLNNKGYLHAEVTMECEKLDKTRGEKKSTKQRANLTYQIRGNQPYHLRHYMLTLPDEEAASLLSGDNKQETKERRRSGGGNQTANSTPLIREGDLFDVDLLNAERERIARRLRNRGYYNFQKELLQYQVDSTLGSHEMDAELALHQRYLDNDSALKIIFTKKYISDITIMMTRDVAMLGDANTDLDTVMINGVAVLYKKGDKMFRPKSLIDKVGLKRGGMYSEWQVERTYSQLTQMGAVRYVNITFQETARDSIAAVIVVSQEKPHTVSAEIEGTFSGGDFGAGVKVGYKNNNIFRGSEEFNVSVNGGYEGMGNLSEVRSAWNIGGNMSLKFPKLLIPTSKAFRQRAVGTTEVSVSQNFQKRPEFDRNIANAGWKYNWRWRRINFSYNFLDISYIYLPRMSEAFKDKYMGPSSSIRFSYEDHFVMRMGLGVNYTNRMDNLSQRNYYTVRANVVTSGNLLYGISNLTGQKRNEEGAYEIFNIRYSQYAKADVDYTYNWLVNDGLRVVAHGGLGVAIPYGNATILPFEERYYSGGSNSMRGWTARTLGPGNMKNTTSSIDFMKQSGDIKLDLNIEARFKIFWKLEGALFTDAGNIWTIRDYAEQPEGQFRWGEFYQQIGWCYGAGIRLDFSFFVVRLDLGIKLYDPGYPNESERWRTELTWKRDCALHFAVGYPF